MHRLAAVFSLCLLAGTAAAQSAPAFSAERYLTDFNQMKRELAARAPNLDWAVAERGLDLKTLADETEAQLRAATTDNAARDAMRRFIGAMGDGHIWLEFPDEKKAETATWGTASICKGLGYEDEERPAGLPFERLGARKLETPDAEVFPALIADLPGGKFGVLRIPSFYQWGYYAYCPQAVAEVGMPENGECDETCGASIAQKSAELLTAAVERQITALKAEGIDALVVDITQNGGGSLWLDPLARMVSSVKLKTPRLAFTRTEAWRASFAASLAAVEADLANPLTAVAYRETLEKAKAVFTTSLAEAEKTCDRSKIWEGQTPACSLMASGHLYATGVLDYAPPGEFGLLASNYALFFSSIYDYQEGLWSGPLYVLIDEGSASASEHFATLLKDNGAAVLIGEPTSGAGCGWMSNGPMTATLTETRAELHIPDCIWTNAAGENEVAGVEPDILVPWRFFDNGFQKARRAMSVLRTLDLSSWAPGQAVAARPVGKSDQPR